MQPAQHDPGGQASTGNKQLFSKAAEDEELDSAFFEPSHALIASSPESAETAESFVDVWATAPERRLSGSGPAGAQAAQEAELGAFLRTVFTERPPGADWLEEPDFSPHGTAAQQQQQQQQHAHLLMQQQQQYAEALRWRQPQQQQQYPPLRAPLPPPLPVGPRLPAGLQLGAPAAGAGMPLPMSAPPLPSGVKFEGLPSFSGPHPPPPPPPPAQMDEYGDDDGDEEHGDDVSAQSSSNTSSRPGTHTQSGTSARRRRGRADRASVLQRHASSNGSSSSHHHHHNQQQRIFYRRSWTPGEDEQLQALVQAYGPAQWTRIAEHMPGKSGNQCSQRWHKALDPDIVKGKWRPDEDELLVQLVEKLGCQWKRISQSVPGRTGKQCRDRYTARLDPALRSGKWTADEERLVMEAHDRLGNKWAAIQKLLPHRSWYTIKWKVESLLRKQGQ